MKERKAKLGTRQKSDSSKYQANSGSAHEEGYLFQHVILGGGKHNARYVRLDSDLLCSVCGQQV